MQFIIMLVIMIIMDITRPVPAPPARPGLGDFQVTTAAQDRRIPVFWGQPWLHGPNLVWYGDLRMEKVKKKIKGIFKDKTQVIGYKYFIGWHLVFGYGNGDVTLLQINAGRDKIWDGNLSKGRGSIDEWGLWGGEEEAGGIAGKFDWEPGGITQGQNSYLVEQLGSRVPAWRTVCALVWRQGYVGTQKTLQQWSIKARRLPQGLQSGHHDIAGEANLAEVQYDILTNKEWGLGLNDNEIDVGTLRANAATLKSEGLGVSLVWDQAKSIEEMLKEVDRHADAVTFQNPITGLWTMKLIRDDYTAADLPRVTPSNATLNSFARPTADELVNEMKVIYASDQFDGRPVPVQVQDEAAYWNRNNQKVSSEVSYPGFTKKNLALLCCTRDLRALSYPYARAQITLNREMFGLMPASRFVLDWEPEGISNMVMIVLEKDIGTLSDGRITVTAVQDIFGVGQALYTETDNSGWVPPSRLPIAPVTYRMDFAPYWVLRSDESVANPESAVPMVLVESPSPTHTGFDMQYTDPSLKGVFVDAPESQEFTPTARLVFDYLETTGIDTSGTLILDNLTAIGSVSGTSLEDLRQTGSGLAIIDSEWIGLGEIVQREDGKYVANRVYRGLLDSTIDRHLAGARIWLVGEGVSRTPTQLSPFASGTYRAKVITRALGGSIDPSLAPILTLTSDGASQNARPLYDYPPRDLAINGLKKPGQITSNSVTVTWKHSNRLLEDQIFLQGDVAPAKPGSTFYRIWLHSDTGAVLAASPEVYSDSYTFGSGDIVGGIPKNGYVRVRTYNTVGQSQPAVLWFGRQVDYVNTQDQAPQRLLDEASPWTFIRMSD